MNTTNGETLGDEEFNQELDAALTKYRTVEPRVGIEERILANLRTKNEQVAPAWRNWFAFGMLAASVAVAFAVLLAWTMERSVPDIATRHPSSTKLMDDQSGAHSTNSEKNDGNRNRTSTPERKLTAHRVQPSVSAISVSCPEIFPSPQPLSEQEQMLADYVAEHRKQAVLVARARMAALKKDKEEEIEQALAKSLISGPITDQTE